MFKILKAKEKNAKTINQMSISEIFKKFSWCRAINRNSILEAEANGETSFYLNPYEQQCFNYGRFTLQDFRDWANKKGPIVKGETELQKKAVVDYVIAKNTFGYEIFTYFEHFHILSSDYKLKDYADRSHSLGMPKKVDSDQLSHIFEYIARGIFHGDFRGISMYNPNSEYYDKKRFEQHKFLVQSHLRGVLKGLYLSRDDVHYAYSNSPKALENLSWAKELIYAYAYFLYLESEGEKIEEIIKKVQSIIGY